MGVEEEPSVSNVRRLEEPAARALRAISSGDVITFGCSAPFALERAGWDSIGFADIPALGCIAHFRVADLNALVPIVRQHLLRAWVEAGLDPAHVHLQLHWGAESRERLFVDQNASSRSCGRRKRGAVVRCHLEVIDRAEHRRAQDKLPRVFL